MITLTLDEKGAMKIEGEAAEIAEFYRETQQPSVAPRIPEVEKKPIAVTNKDIVTLKGAQNVEYFVVQAGHDFLGLANVGQGLNITKWARRDEVLTNYGGMRG